MGRQIILSEDEKRNIREMYGLVNEQPSTSIVRAISTIANGGKASDIARKTSNSPSSLSKKNTKFEQLKGKYYHDDDPRLKKPYWMRKFNGKNVSSEESGTNYIINDLTSFTDEDGVKVGIVLHLTKDGDRSDYLWMYYMCETEKWYSSNGKALMSDFNEEFYNIGNETQNGGFCEFRKNL